MGRCQRWLLDFYVLYDDDTTETGNPHKKDDGEGKFMSSDLHILSIEKSLINSRRDI